MSEATSHSAHWVQDDTEITKLAAQVTDPAREKLIVCVTTQPSLDRPYVDPDVLAERLGDRADVWAITASEHAWALTEALPSKIDVYGGAVRAWQPIREGQDVYPSDHPQWTVFSEGDAPKVIDAITEYATLAENPPPEFGSEATATVTAVRKAGAELQLESGHPAFASNQHLVQTGDVYHAREILQVGQQVQVRVGPWHPQAMRVSVSLRDFAPDPWERIEEQYRIGSIIEVVVSTIQPYGAFVELLPGAEGLLHKSKIVDEFVHDIEDYVRPGDRIAVRLASLDPYGRKAEVTMIDVRPGDAPEPLGSVYPGGPAWLPDSPEGFGEDEPAEAGEGDSAVPSWGAAVREHEQPEARAAAEATAAELRTLRARVAELKAALAAATGTAAPAVVETETDTGVVADIDPDTAKIEAEAPEVGVDVLVDAAPEVEVEAPEVGVDALVDAVAEVVAEGAGVTELEAPVELPESDEPTAEAVDEPEA